MRYFGALLLVLLSACAHATGGDLTKSLPLRTRANTVGFFLDDVRSTIVAGCQLNDQSDELLKSKCHERQRSYNAAHALQVGAEDLVDFYEIAGQGYDQAARLVDAAEAAAQEIKHE